MTDRDTPVASINDHTYLGHYGASLPGHADLFNSWASGADSPGGRCEFAAAAFTIACGLIEGPSYVRLHPRVERVGRHYPDADLVAVELELIAPSPPAVAGALARWRGRPTHTCGTGRAGGQRWWRIPDPEAARPAAFTTLTLRVPLDPTGLPAPAYHGRDRLPDLDTVVTAVEAVCDQLNTTAGPVVAALDNSGTDAGPHPGLPHTRWVGVADARGAVDPHQDTKSAGGRGR